MGNMTVTMRSTSWVLAIVVGLLAGCRDRQGLTQDQISRIRDSERAIRPFDPSTLHDTTRQHVALKFRVVGDSLQFLPDSVFFRPGKIPYRPRGAGDFKVTFRDSTGREVGSYTTEDPRTLRACDVSVGRPATVSSVTTGIVEILAPANSAIVSVDISNASGARQSFFLGGAFHH
jgi:hypothetical protein